MIRVALPWPPTPLWPNRRAHWRTKSKAASGYRSTAFYLCQNVKGAIPETGPIQCSITFHPPNLIRRDWDNMLAAIKSGLDGIAQAYGIDDSRFQPGLMVGDTVTHGMVKVQLSWTDSQYGDGTKPC